MGLSLSGRGLVKRGGARYVTISKITVNEADNINHDVKVPGDQRSKTRRGGTKVKASELGWIDKS